MEELR